MFQPKQEVLDKDWAETKDSQRAAWGDRGRREVCSREQNDLVKGQRSVTLAKAH